MKRKHMKLKRVNELVAKEGKNPRAMRKLRARRNRIACSAGWYSESVVLA